MIKQTKEHIIVRTIVNHVKWCRLQASTIADQIASQDLTSKGLHDNRRRLPVMLQGHFGQQTSAMRTKELMGHIASQGLHGNQRRMPVMLQAPVVGGRLWIDRDVRHVILVTAGERVILNLDRLYIIGQHCFSRRVNLRKSPVD